MTVLVSIEQHLNYLTYHIIYINGAYVHTYAAKTITAAKKIKKILDFIFTLNYHELTEFFKEEDGIIHTQVTYSLGRNIRNKMKQNTRQKEEQKNGNY